MKIYSFRNVTYKNLKPVCTDYEQEGRNSKEAYAKALEIYGADIGDGKHYTWRPLI